MVGVRVVGGPDEALGPTASMMCGAARSSGSPEMKHWRRKYSDGGIESGTPFAEIVSNAASMRSRNEPIQPQPTSSTPSRSSGSARARPS
jgi:hypothetical protein